MNGHYEWEWWKQLFKKMMIRFASNVSNFRNDSCFIYDLHVTMANSNQYYIKQMEANLLYEEL